MDDYYENLAIKRKRDEQKDKEYKEASKERLLKISCTKVRTTMIGALDSIEKKLSPLWNVEEGKRLTNDQLRLKQLYEEVRNEILDRGNTQIRNLETEFQQYEINWKRYTLQLPIINKERKDG